MQNVANIHRWIIIYGCLYDMAYICWQTRRGIEEIGVSSARGCSWFHEEERSRSPILPLCLPSTKPLTWHWGRTPKNFYPSPLTIHEESLMSKQVTQIHLIHLAVITFLWQWNFTQFVWPRLCLIHIWMTYDRLQSNLNLIARIKVRDTFLILSWSEWAWD